MRENKVLGIVFSNMHDSMIGELTEKRTTGSVPFGGRYRLIDFALSSMVNSDISDIGIITKQNYQSLMDHIGSGRAWDLARKRGGLVILPPFASQGSGIYRGRLEALGGAMSYIRHNDAKYVLITDCDIIANMDLRPFINEHIKSGAQISMMVKNTEISPESQRDTTTVLFDEQTGDVTDILVRPDVKGSHYVYMNILLLEKTLLERMVNEAKSHDQYSMVRHALQPSIGKRNIKAYEFKGYTHKISGMKSYFTANMELLDPAVRAELFPKNLPIYTKVRDQVPVKYGLSAKVGNSLMADGCIINGEVENCVIFRGAKIGKGAVLKNCIIMQNTYVGDNAHLEYVVTDKDVLIRDSRTLIGYETYPIYVAKGSSI
ncbi:glucose-1-phosphate adenylyltransferase subunit GlgD [Anaerotruncus rubiinfantis]|jgi:glucose-1-phosphate adenylyltransferase|uniref:glucose-1-phosphate adenylyltransferase subunit GlgD n=1 Tax=Anaerotruncus rubiinfantis TaxID=1720200 RepID=UPI000836505E|nr:glucose-1-phosphate adenylyltransferase subunit GlgD [Anaerotruncus rubiinfantis]